MDTITNDQQANWAIEKICEHQKAIANHEQRRDKFIAEYQLRIDNANRICDEDCAEHLRAIDSLKDLLRDYALQNLPDGKRTLKFPAGKIFFRERPAKFFFDGGEECNKNSHKLIDYFKNYAPDFVITDYSADWANFKRLLDFDPKTGDVFFKSSHDILKHFHAEKPNDKFDITTY